MSPDEKTTTKSSEETTTTTTKATENLSSEAVVEQERSEKILKAKELYSHGSRNFLVKSYAEAADELSQVCALYEELYGELSDELGMPYLLYAKSLIALALDENKVIDVPDEEEDDDEDEEGEGEQEENAAESAETTNGEAKAGDGGTKLESIKEDDAAVVDSTGAEEEKTEKSKESEKTADESQVSSTDDDKAKAKKEEESKAKAEEKKATNGGANGAAEKSLKTTPVKDEEKPSTSNGEAGGDVEEEEENEAASNLQLAWEILELSAKIFSRQGEGGLSNLAEVQTELANIEFENNILDSARDDYERALNIYKELPNNYRRAMAEIHYKIGLTFLMQQANKEGAASLKEACKLIAGEIDEIKAKTELNDKDKNNIQDMEETKQEIEAKITEIEETQAQNVAEVRAALDSYIKPLSSGDVDAGSSKSAVAAAASSSALSSSSSSAAITSSSKPSDISHLIKRKKPEEPTSEAEAAVACSPAKRPAV